MATTYADIATYAGRSAEQATRIAGVVTRYNDPDATQIDAPAARAAVELTRHYIEEYRHLRQMARGGGALDNARLLAKWLIGDSEPGGDIDPRRILKYGPNRMRGQQQRDDALAVLEAHGWISRSPRKQLR